VREFLFVETQFFNIFYIQFFNRIIFFICFPVYLKLSFFTFIYVKDGWKKKKHLFFHYISIVILYVFFFNLYFRCLYSSIFCFCPIYIYIYFFFHFLFITLNSEKKTRERDSIRCFSMKNYTVIIFFLFPIIVLFQFFIFISQ
jgi:hypothetical protein